MFSNKKRCQNHEGSFIFVHVFRSLKKLLLSSIAKRYKIYILLDSDIGVKEVHEFFYSDSKNSMNLPEKNSKQSESLCVNNSDRLFDFAFNMVLFPSIFVHRKPTKITDFMKHIL